MVCPGSGWSRRSRVGLGSVPPPAGSGRSSSAASSQRSRTRSWAPAGRAESWHKCSYASCWRCRYTACFAIHPSGFPLSPTSILSSKSFLLWWINVCWPQFCKCLFSEFPRRRADCKGAFTDGGKEKEASLCSGVHSDTSPVWRPGTRRTVCRTAEEVSSCWRNLWLAQGWSPHTSGAERSFGAPLATRTLPEVHRGHSWRDSRVGSQKSIPTS